MRITRRRRPRPPRTDVASAFPARANDHTGARARIRETLGLAVAAVASTLAQPSTALACATCFGGQPNDWTGGFFLGTIVMLSLPPLIVIGAGVAIYRAIKRQEQRIRERDERRAREAVGQGAS